tara:strand:+ start:330 stop:563 length:234 start_codon:yes stop_codon:yes gene_type:complete
MKALVLASTLGFSLFAGSAMAAVSADSSAVFRTEASKVENVDKDIKKSNDWRRTQFNPVDSTKKDTKSAQIWRKVRV